jgi:hypothetical protein
LPESLADFSSRADAAETTAPHAEPLAGAGSLDAILFKR